jgi:hypothetical protein
MAKKAEEQIAEVDTTVIEKVIAAKPVVIQKKNPQMIGK